MKKAVHSFLHKFIPAYLESAMLPSYWYLRLLIQLTGVGKHVYLYPSYTLYLQAELEGAESETLSNSYNVSNMENDDIYQFAQM